MMGGTQSRRRGWSQTTTLTAYVTSGVNAFSFFPRELDAESSDFTLQFDLTPLVNNTQRTEAIVSWMNEGNVTARRISVTMGTSITGRGQGATVQLIDTTAHGAGGQYQVTISGSQGVRAFNSIPPFLMGDYGTLATTTSSAAIVIPKNAGIQAMQVLVSGASSSAPANFTVAVRRHDGTVIQAWSPMVAPGYVNLAPEADYFILTNSDATNPATYTVLYGIEG